MKLPLVFFAGLDDTLIQESKSLMAGSVAVRFLADAASLSDCLAQQLPDVVVIAEHLPDSQASDLAALIKREYGVRVCLCVSGSDALASAIEIDAEVSDELWVGVTQSVDLVRRVFSALRERAAWLDLQQQLRGTQQVAMTAMSSMGELGVVLRFLSDCFAKASHEAVAESVLSALKSYDYSGACQIRGSGFRVTRLSGDATVGASEEALAKLSTIGRIVEFKSRMVVNYPNVTVMISNLGEDPDVRGRARDNIALLAEGAQARVVSLLIESDNRSKRDGIGFALSEIRDMALALEETQRSAFDDGSMAINTALVDLFHAFVGMGLSENQEARILDSLGGLRNHVETLSAAGSVASARLQSVSRSLQELVDAGEQS
jgi:hypothetical protein